jgi:hypothetical protein
MKGGENEYKSFVGELQGTRSFGMSKSRLDDNTKMHITEIGLEGVY